MAYPTLERYQEALQHPATVFLDPELQQASVKTSGLGMPLALCGGFALTYAVTSGAKRYAVRCFHKQSPALEARYIAISKRLQSLKSPYFLDFVFQQQGIRIDQKVYPVVKMAWASGETLGEFLETNYRNKTALGALRHSLQDLAAYLDQQHISHGDIQTGNVMVSDGGRRVQLIDYDGMFVDEIRPLGSSELGHRNFQHPGRAASNPFDGSMDRFSLIALTMALRALEEDANLWLKTRSDIDGIIFRANDFIAPESSIIFNDLSKRASLGQDTKNFAAICKAAFGTVPTLADFLARRNLPTVSVLLSGVASGVRALAYLAPYPVLNGSDYAHCLRHIGDRVELIGQVFEVRDAKTRYGKPYVFLNFGHWEGEIVKITIWSDGLNALAQKPDQSWVGKWISVVGLMEPPYSKKGKTKYRHPTITVSKNNELSVIDGAEAQFRLAGSRVAPSTKNAASNENILEKIGAKSKAAIFPIPPTNPKHQPIQRSANRDLLEKMKQSSSPSAAPGQAPVRPKPAAPSSSRAQPPIQHSKTTIQSSYNSPSHRQKKGFFESIFDFFFK